MTRLLSVLSYFRAHSGCVALLVILQRMQEVVCQDCVAVPGQYETCACTSGEFTMDLHTMFDEPPFAGKKPL